MGEWNRYVIEIGMGIDHHGQNSTKAAVRAIKDAISRVYLIGLLELFKLNFESDIKTEVLIGVPYSKSVNKKELKEAIPLNCKKVINIVDGGLKGRGTILKEFKDKTDEIIIAIALITIYVRGKKR